MTDPIADRLVSLITLLARIPLTVSLSKNGQGDYVVRLAKDKEWVEMAFGFDKPEEVLMVRDVIADELRSAEFQLTYRTERKDHGDRIASRKGPRHKMAGT